MSLLERPGELAGALLELLSLAPPHPRDAALTK